MARVMVLVVALLVMAGSLIGHTAATPGGFSGVDRDTAELQSRGSPVWFGFGIAGWLSVVNRQILRETIRGIGSSATTLEAPSMVSSAAGIADGSSVTGLAQQVPAAVTWIPIGWTGAYSRGTGLVAGDVNRRSNWIGFVEGGVGGCESEFFGSVQSACVSYDQRSCFSSDALQASAGVPRGRIGRLMGWAAEFLDSFVVLVCFCHDLGLWA